MGDGRRGGGDLRPRDRPEGVQNADGQAPADATPAADAAPAEEAGTELIEVEIDPLPAVTDADWADVDLDPSALVAVAGPLVAWGGVTYGA